MKAQGDWRPVSNSSNVKRDGLSRRNLFQAGVFQAGGVMAAGLTAGTAEAAPTGPSADVYTRIGARPFINCTATLTINGGSLMFPEVIAAMEQASHFHIDLDELMEKVSARLTELLQVPGAIVTGGTAAALTMPRQAFWRDAMRRRSSGCRTWLG